VTRHLVDVKLKSQLRQEPMAVMLTRFAQRVSLAAEASTISSLL